MRKVYSFFVSLRVATIYHTCRFIAEIKQHLSSEESRARKKRYEEMTEYSRNAGNFGRTKRVLPSRKKVMR